MGPAVLLRLPGISIHTDWRWRIVVEPQFVTLSGPPARGSRPSPI